MFHKNPFNITEIYVSPFNFDQIGKKEFSKMNYVSLSLTFIFVNKLLHGG